jgi:hypothetical protein
MPASLPLDSDPQIPPPYNCPGVTIQSFRLTSKVAQQQLLVDEYLNIGDPLARGFYYQAFLPFVDMDFVYYPNMSSGMSQLPNMGSITQSELYFKIYVVKFVPFLDVFWLPVPAIIGFFPYMFVDNSWSMIAGREVSGFPKLLASFTPPPQQAIQANQPLRPYPIQATTLAFNTVGPGTQAQQLPFVTIQALAQAPGNNVVRTSDWTLSLADLKALDDPAVVDAIQSALQSDPSLLQTVQLKQFRAAGSRTDACFQGIVEGQFAVSNMTFLNPPLAQIVINAYATLSIAAALGLDASPVSPISQYAVTCDLLYTEGETTFVNQ